jgi:hypothetical protein
VKRFAFVLVALVYAPLALQAQPNPTPDNDATPDSPPAPENLEDEDSDEDEESEDEDEDEDGPETPPGSVTNLPQETDSPSVTGQADPDPDARQRQTDFMDTRLSFTCTHEDVLREADVLPSAPGFHCGRPNALGVLFFDNYDTRFSGFETLSHLALYSHWNENHWDIEGGFIVRFNELAEDNIRLADGGSYIRAAYWFDANREAKRTLALVAFPVSSDRMRLGYSYRISWGGSPEFFKANPDAPGSIGKNPESVPGAKLQFDDENFYAYLGVKSSLLLDPEINEKRSVGAIMAGVGADLTPMIRVEANGGAFDRGKNETEDVLGEPVILYGASAQVVVHQGMPVGSSIDYKLYRNEPESVARLFRREEYPGGISWLASVEGTLLGQTLKDPSTPGGTTTQIGFAADLNVRVKIEHTRLRLDVMTRDLAYILHSIPSLPTYWDFPETYTATPELFVAAGADQFFPGSDLTLGVVVGLDLPATLETPTAADIPGNMTDSTTLVIRNESSRSILPQGEPVAPIIAVKGSGRIDFGNHFAFLADLYYQYDPNTVRYDRTAPEGSFNRASFANFHQLGFNITMQARF